MKNNLILNYSGLTNVGLVREHNEDCYAIDEKQELFIVADGLGGHKGGEIASNLAINTIIDFLKNNSIQIEPASKISQAIEKAHQIILEIASREVSLSKMGSTVVLALRQTPDTINIANIGDSRAYLYRDRVIRLLSEDHSLVEEMFRRGLLSAEQKRTHPDRNLITRAIGIKLDRGPFQRELVLKENDKLILCSDGLWDMISDETIGEILSNCDRTEDMCSELVAAANCAGGEDNITVIAILVEKKSDRKL